MKSSRRLVVHVTWNRSKKGMVVVANKNDTFESVKQNIYRENGWKIKPVAFYLTTRLDKWGPRVRCHYQEPIRNVATDKHHLSVKVYLNGKK